MKAFSFRLETLLHLREMAKDKAIADYGLAIAKREDISKCSARAKASNGGFA